MEEIFADKTFIPHRNTTTLKSFPTYLNDPMTPITLLHIWSNLRLETIYAFVVKSVASCTAIKNGGRGRRGER